MMPAPVVAVAEQGVSRRCRFLDIALPKSQREPQVNPTIAYVEPLPTALLAGKASGF